MNSNLQDLENLEVVKVEEKPLQKIKLKKNEKIVVEDVKQDEVESEYSTNLRVADDVIAKPSKRERTEKQKEALLKAREKMLFNSEQRKQIKAKEDEIRKKEIENKIIQKAISIKKKEIKRKAILDEISDDETPIEEIKKIAKPKPIIPEKPKTIFEKYKFI